MTDSKQRVKRQVQVDQTYFLLWRALDRLMSEKEFDKISVSAICLEAGVARRTFYRHFSTTEDLLTVRIEQLIKELYRLSQQVVHFDDLVVVIYDYFKPHKIFLTLLNQRGKSHLLQQAILENKSLSVFDDKKISQARLIYYFGAGGISNLIQYFIVTGFKDETEDVRKMADELLEHLELLVHYEKKNH